MEKPLPFQIEDGAFLQEGQRALWSEPGTGKTLGAIVGLLPTSRSLTVAPASATTQWARKMRAQGLEAGVLDPDRPAPPHAVISWGLLTKGMAQAFADAGRPDVLILDEAHKAVRQTAQRTTAALDLVRRAGMAWPLTGTPMIRYADDLWPMTNALWPEHLRSLGLRNRSTFERRLCRLRMGVVVGSRAFTLKTLHETLDGLRGLPRVVVRRTLREVAPHLPAVTARELEMPLTRTEARRLDKLLTPDLLTRLDAAEAMLDEDDPHVAAARRALGLMKAPEVAELAKEAPGKVIVAYYHREAGDALQELLGADALRLDGSTPQGRRQAIVDNFNDPGGPQLFLLQMVAGGEAINPHEQCGHLIFAERDWSGAVMEQAVRRVRRFGQTRRQQIDFVDGDHPLEKHMRRTAARKSRDLAVLMGEGD